MSGEAFGEKNSMPSQSDIQNSKRTAMLLMSMRHNAPRSMRARANANDLQEEKSQKASEATATKERRDARASTRKAAAEAEEENERAARQAAAAQGRAAAAHAAQAQAAAQRRMAMNRARLAESIRSSHVYQPPPPPRSSSLQRQSQRSMQQAGPSQSPAPAPAPARAPASTSPRIYSATSPLNMRPPRTTSLGRLAVNAPTALRLRLRPNSTYAQAGPSQPKRSRPAAPPCSMNTEDPRHCSFSERIRKVAQAQAQAKKQGKKQTRK